MRTTTQSAVKPLGYALLMLVAAGPTAGEQVVTPLGMAPDERAETIQQRDAHGRIRVRRQVRLDTHGDYVNHGHWRAWNEAGRLEGQGRYAWGKPTGLWSRWAEAEDAPLLEIEPFDRFEGPFLSQASYRDGRLEGVWSIFDAQGRRASEIHFRAGERHGQAVLYGVDGQVFERRAFEAGFPTGPHERLVDDKLQVVAEYQEGREILRCDEHYEGGALRSRDSWLGPLNRVAAPDDPWRVRIAELEATGPKLRHGRREAWWPNGQMKLVAHYRHGRAIGEARWWHANGQLALAGEYQEGLAVGDWSWWREDGRRATTRCYVAGRLIDENERGGWAAGAGPPVWAGEGSLADRPTATSLR